MKTELVSIELHTQRINDKLLHRVTTSREIVEVRRLYVPQVQDDQVVVLGVYLHPGLTNILSEPILLGDLNAMLRVAQFLYVERACSAYVQLDDPHWPLQLEALCKIEEPWWPRYLDDAYRGWLKENPESTISDWGQFVQRRIWEGEMVCECHQCEDPAVVGTLRCQAHQNV